jgi:hypothetical protein
MKIMLNKSPQLGKPEMKTLIIALALTATLAQAQTADECQDAFASTIGFSKVTEPILDDCLADEMSQCAVFIGVMNKANITPKIEMTAVCIDLKQIDLGLILTYSDLIERMKNKTVRLAAKLAKREAGK